MQEHPWIGIIVADGWAFRVYLTAIILTNMAAAEIKASRLIIRVYRFKDLVVSLFMYQFFHLFKIRY